MRNGGHVSFTQLPGPRAIVWSEGAKVHALLPAGKPSITAQNRWPVVNVGHEPVDTRYRRAPPKLNGTRRVVRTSAASLVAPTSTFQLIVVDGEVR